MSLVRSLALLCTVAAPLALAVSPIEVHGSQFVNSKTNDRLQLLGIDYQPGGSSGYTDKKDPLTDPDACLRDAALMQKLGVNTVRIYNISPELNHDECMSIFNAAGIYLILDVNSPLLNGALNAAEPWTTYNKYYLKRIFSMVEAFKDYPNLIGFFGGNEVLNEDAVHQTPSYVKAVQRDLKAYMKKNSDRQIPVGYSAADIRKQVADQLHYLTCDDGSGSDSGADFFGMNVYSWCGDATYEEAGYDVLTDIFSNTSIPVFFSEYGCNEVTPRQFTEVGTIYGPQMSEVWSGGLVYEWTQEANNYGIVKLDHDGNAKLLKDYDTLQKQFAKLDMKKLQQVNSTDSAAKAPKCAKSLITSKGFPTDFTLPKLPPGGQYLIDNGVQGITPGKIVPVKNTKVSAKITDASGNEVKGLELKPVAASQNDAANAKNHATGTKSSVTPVSTIHPGGTAAAATSEDEDAADSTMTSVSSSGAARGVVGSTLLAVAALFAVFM